jgi:hypothetical protein
MAPLDFDSVKKKATLPTRTVSLCLAGELVEEHARLEQALAELPPPTSLGDGGGKRDLAQQILDVEEQMREATVEFHLKALGAKVWTLFWGSMPTRGEKESDDAWSERIFPFWADMVSRCCVEPRMTAAQVTELSDMLHSGAWNRLLGGCLALNQGGIDLPNSAAASELISTSEQT